MAGYINPDVLDNGLNIITASGNKLVICSQLPATYVEANSTYILGSKISPNISVPQNRVPDGRKVIVAAVLDGSVSASGTATHYAILDTTNSRLLAAQALGTPQYVTIYNTFTLTIVDIGIPGSTA